MTVAFAVFLVGHGLLHLIGVAKAFRLASLPQLTQPITPGVGIVWLVAAALFVLSAGALLVWPRWWWILTAAGAVVSTAAIVPSWTDARFGAVANLLVGAGALFGFLAQGPGSLRASYEADIARAVLSGPHGDRWRSPISPRSRGRCSDTFVSRAHWGSLVSSALRRGRTGAFEAIETRGGFL